MKFFCLNNEREGSCYLECQRGHREGDYWLKDSIFLDDDIAIETELYDILFEVLRKFDPYSALPYYVNKREWNDIYNRAASRGGETKEMIVELKSWADDNFRDYKEFTIVTI